MATIPSRFQDDSGETRLDGQLVTDQPLNADTIGGVAINNTPSGANETLQTVDASNAQWAPGGGSQPSNYIVGKTIIDFQETAGAGTYTAEFVIPAGAMIGDVRIYGVSNGPWDADTAVLDAGDDSEAQGFIKTQDLTTILDQTYDPRVQYNNGEGFYSWAGTPVGPDGDYNRNNAFGTDNQDGGVPYPAGGTFTATVVTTGAGGTTGAFRMEVFGYGLPAETINAVKS